MPLLIKSLNSKNLKRLCVISDLNNGIDSCFDEAGISLAIAMVKAEIGLVCRDYYGNGLMGTIGRIIKEGGGHITNILSDPLFDRKQYFDNVDKYFLTDGIHECKMLMFKISDGFVVLPGSVSTVDVLMEYLTWMQRLYQSKPVYIVNIKNFWKPLIKMLDRMRDELFLPADFNERYILVEDIKDIVPNFERRKSCL